MKSGRHSENDIPECTTRMVLDGTDKSCSNFSALLESAECVRSDLQKYHHSYSEEKTADRDSAAERSYYSPDQEYFQLSSKTIFFHRFHGRGVSESGDIKWVSFESRAKVYNERFKTKDAMKLEKIAHLFKMGSETDQPWLLYQQRLEEAWFLLKIVKYYHHHSGCLSF